MRGLLKPAFFSLLLLPILFSVPAVASKPGSVSLSISLSPAGSFEAKSEALKVDGTAVKVGDGFVAKNVTLPLDSLHTGIGLRDNHMKENYFETKKYPTAVLTQAIGKDGKFTGELKLHNVTKPISGTYTLSGGDAVASFKCKMSDFTIPEAKYMGVGADDEVEVKATLPLAPGAEGKT